jgi:hypothetical protein
MRVRPRVRNYAYQSARVIGVELHWMITNLACGHLAFRDARRTLPRGCDRDNADATGTTRIRRGCWVTRRVCRARLFELCKVHRTRFNLRPQPQPYIHATNGNIGLR